MFFRGELGHRGRGRLGPLTMCTSCGADLRHVPHDAIASVPTIDTRDVEAERTRALILARRWAALPGHGPVYSHPYFDRLRQLCRLLASSRATTVLRAACRRYGMADHKVTLPARSARTGRDVERFGAAARRHVALRATRLPAARQGLPRWDER